MFRNREFNNASRASFLYLTWICQFFILLFIVTKCTMFGSTFICKFAFFKVIYIKNKVRSQLINEYIVIIMMILLTNYTPNFQQLVESKTCHFPLWRIYYNLFLVFIVLREVINMHNIFIGFYFIIYEICILNIDGPRKLSEFLM